MEYMKISLHKIYGGVYCGVIKIIKIYKKNQSPQENIKYSNIFLSIVKI